jgi:pyrimidine-nucleoside phosphorylase
VEGEPIASVFARDQAGIELGLGALRDAIGIGGKLEQKPLPLVSHRVTKAGVEALAAIPQPLGRAPRAAPRG